jgi:hypothetical protein
MKKSEAKPGVKVLATYAPAYQEYSDEEIVEYQYDIDGDGDLVGVIRSREAKPGFVWVKWIDGDYLDSIDGECESQIDLKILMLESDRNQIEEDFKRVSKEVKEKMKAAAKLVNEAGKLARSARCTLESMHAADALVNAMDDNGWRSSSWGCFL